MESADTSGTNLEFARVLAGGAPNGHRVELLELTGGGFAITCNGARQAVYEAGACNLESCMKSYLAFLRTYNEARLIPAAP